MLACLCNCSTVDCCLAQRARALVALGNDPARALKDLHRAKEISPRNLEVLGDIAMDEAEALMQMRQFEEAFLALKRAERCKVERGLNRDDDDDDSDNDNDD